MAAPLSRVWLRYVYGNEIRRRRRRHRTSSGFFGSTNPKANIATTTATTIGNRQITTSNRQTNDGNPTERKINSPRL